MEFQEVSYTPALDLFLIAKKDFLTLLSSLLILSTNNSHPPNIQNWLPQMETTLIQLNPPCFPPLRLEYGWLGFYVWKIANSCRDTDSASLFSFYHSKVMASWKNVCFLKVELRNAAYSAGFTQPCLYGGGKQFSLCQLCHPIWVLPTPTTIA